MRVLKLSFLALAFAVSVPAAPSAQDIDVTISRMHWNNPALRVGQDYTLKAGEVAREVAVIAGDATIAGRVDRDVVVTLGKVQIESTAVIEGSLVVLGGTAVVAEGAQVREDLFVIGGFEGVPGFNPGGHHVVIGTAGLNELNARNGKIEFSGTIDPLIITGDAFHLERVFLNLIDNAIKYAKEAPVIEINLFEKTGYVHVEISDNGIGIAKDEQKRIFDRFYRVSTGDLHNVKGFGLGLSYVKTIVELHRGTIEVESKPGKGSIFRIKFKR